MSSWEKNIFNWEMVYETTMENPKGCSGFEDVRERKKILEIIALFAESALQFLDARNGNRDNIDQSISRKQKRVQGETCLEKSSSRLEHFLSLKIEKNSLLTRLYHFRSIMSLIRPAKNLKFELDCYLRIWNWGLSFRWKNSRRSFWKKGGLEK